MKRTGFVLCGWIYGLLALQTAIAVPVPYTNETDFINAVAALDYVYVMESFEDDEIWGVARSTVSGGTHALTAATNFSIRFSSNTNVCSITTSEGPPRTGDWGGYSIPHGSYATDSDCDVPGNCGDGIQLQSTQPMYAFSVWVTGSWGGKLDVILNGDRLNPVDFPEICDTNGENCINYNLLGAGHLFFGVIDSEGFNRVELREIEGTAEDQKFIWCDDLIAAFSNPPPPLVRNVSVTNSTIHIKELAVRASYAVEVTTNLLTGIWGHVGDFTAESTETNQTIIISNEWNRADFRIRSL